MDRGVWWATVHGVTKSWTRLSDYTTDPLATPFDVVKTASLLRLLLFNRLRYMLLHRPVL